MIKIEGDDFKWLIIANPGDKLSLEKDVMNNDIEIDANYVTFHNGVAYEDNLIVKIVQISPLTREIRKIELSRESFEILKTLEV